MRPLERSLRSTGFRTLSITYPGRRKTLPDIAEYLRPVVAQLAIGSDGPVHFVTHSLGGLVVRALLASYRPENLGRVVMLAPPNYGSEWADLLKRLRLDRVVLGPVAQYLVTKRCADNKALLGSSDYPVGIIAGDRALDPLFPRLLMPRPNDGKVSVASTYLTGMTDHITLPVSHTLMVYDRRVKAQVVAFLRDGLFDRSNVVGGDA